MRPITAYYTEVPDPQIPAQRVTFGTSGQAGVIDLTTHGVSSISGTYQPAAEAITV